MDAATLDYELPDACIAQRPAEPRDAARLLVDDGAGRAPRHLHVFDLPSLVRPGDLVVLNTTRVLPARLHLRKATGGAAEVLLLDQRDDGTWEALVRPGRRLPSGTCLGADRGGLEVVVGERLGEDGRRSVEVRHDGDLLDALERVGEVPLPPYVHEPLPDPDRYQTVYAERPGSVAAPTAGLHLTPAVLDAVRAAGAELAHVELVVGLGTFRPITAERVEDHTMHEERYRVAPEVLDAAARASRTLAVGTTTVRALESAAATGAHEGRTDLFITPGFSFQVVDVLLTNFHLPRSSLLAMVEAFVGPRWRDLYATARADGYRFLSFGDAMLLARREGER